MPSLVQPTRPDCTVDDEPERVAAHGQLKMCNWSSDQTACCAALGGGTVAACSLLLALLGLMLGTHHLKVLHYIIIHPI